MKRIFIKLIIVRKIEHIGIAVQMTTYTKLFGKGPYKRGRKTSDNSFLSVGQIN